MADNYGGEQPQEPGETGPLPPGEPAPEARGADPSHPPAGWEPPVSGADPSNLPYGSEPPVGSQPPGGTEPLAGSDPLAGSQPPGGTEPLTGSEPPVGSEPPGPAGDVPPLPGNQVYGSPAPGDDVLTGGYWPPPPPGNMPPPPGYGYGGYGGYGQGGYGQGGYGPGGYGGYGGYGAWPGQPQPPRRRGRALLAAAVIAIVAAGAGAAATLALRNTGNNEPNGPSGPGANAVPRPGSQRPPLNNTGVNKVNVSAIAKEVGPSVVDITSNISEPQSVTAQGTGIVLNSHGLVLTNNHVIADASKVTAQVAGTNQTYPVTVLGTDASGDVALLQMQGASGLKGASFGDSSKTAVGDGVVDLGNACGQGGTPTVTSGAVTALNRSIQAGNAGNQSSENLRGMLQTDAAITEGDSGGPLVNSSGQVIGMVTAAEGTGSSCQQTSNIGFAIPVDTALSIARQIAGGHGGPGIQIGPRAGLGVSVEDASSAAQGQGGQGGHGGPGGGIGGPGGGIGGGPGGGYSPPVNSGALIVQVVQGSPAQAAGLTAGDVITGLNGSTISSSSALSTALSKFHPGNHVSVTYVDANGKHHTVPVTLGTVPPA